MWTCLNATWQGTVSVYHISLQANPVCLMSAACADTPHLKNTHPCHKHKTLIRTDTQTDVKTHKSLNKVCRAVLPLHSFEHRKHLITATGSEAETDKLFLWNRVKKTRTNISSKTDKMKRSVSGNQYPSNIIDRVGHDLNQASSQNTVSLHFERHSDVLIREPSYVLRMCSKFPVQK